MLRIYPICQEVAREALKVARVIHPHDRNLADQLARAGTSIPLNVSEGSYSRGGNRNSRYHTAMGSASETRTILELVEGAGWVARDEVLHARLRQIIGTLVRVLRLA